MRIKKVGRGSADQTNLSFLPVCGCVGARFFFWPGLFSAHADGERRGAVRSESASGGAASDEAFSARGRIRPRALGAVRRRAALPRENAETQKKKQARAAA